MKELVLAVKSRLQTDSNLSYVRDTDIWITEDESILPVHTKFPAIAIKDGAVRNEQMLTGNYLQHAQVRITVYQQVLKSEESIVGTHGVLDMAADVITSLIDNSLSLTGIQNVFPVAEDASQLFGDEEEMIQRKTIIMDYKRHKTWG
jgi:hypothetical protein